MLRIGPGRRVRAARLAPALVLLAGGLAGWLVLPDLLSLESLREHRAALLACREAGPLPAALAYVALFVLVVAFSLPGAFAMTVAGGFLFGLVPGTLLATGAASLGAAAVFLAVRAGVGDAGAPRAHAAAARFPALAAGLRRNELGWLLALRLVPLVPFPVANVAPALLGVGLRRFVATTFVGILPGTLLSAWIGVGTGRLLDRGEAPGLRSALRWELLDPALALAALVVLALAAAAVRARRRP